MLNKIFNAFINEVKSYHPKAIKANWKAIDERKATIQKLSDHTGLKKVYFDCLSEEEFNAEVEKMNGIKLLKLGRGAYHHYKTSVRGNKNISFEEAQAKLTRNVMLAYKSKRSDDNKQLYLYGKLGILVVGNKIKWVKNNMSAPKSWRKDMVRYKQISKELGIVE